MSRRKNTRKRRSERKRRSGISQRQESRPAEIATVGWMLAVFATLAAEVVGIIVRLMMIVEPVTPQLRLLSGTMLTVAFVSGFITLVLTPIVLKLRKLAPPLPIVAAACVIGFIPIATLVMVVTRP